MRSMIFTFLFLPALVFGATFGPLIHRSTELSQRITPQEVTINGRAASTIEWAFTQDKAAKDFSQASQCLLKFEPLNRAWSYTVTGAVYSATGGIVRFDIWPADCDTNGTFLMEISISAGSTNICKGNYGQLTILRAVGTSTNAFPGTNAVADLAGKTFLNYPWLDYGQWLSSVASQITSDQTNAWSQQAAGEPLWIAASGSVIYASDYRLTNSRPPTAHTQDVSTITGAATAASVSNIQARTSAWNTAATQAAAAYPSNNPNGYITGFVCSNTADSAGVLSGTGTNRGVGTNLTAYVKKADTNGWITSSHDGFLTTESDPLSWHLSGDNLGGWYPSIGRDGDEIGGYYNYRWTLTDGSGSVALAIPDTDSDYPYSFLADRLSVGFLFSLYDGSHVAQSLFSIASDRTFNFYDGTATNLNGAGITNISAAALSSEPWLLTNGTRAMSGSLNMGGYQVSNVTYLSKSLSAPAPASIYFQTGTNALLLGQWDFGSDASFMSMGNRNLTGVNSLTVSDYVSGRLIGNGAGITNIPNSALAGPIVTNSFASLSVTVALTNRVGVPLLLATFPRRMALDWYSANMVSGAGSNAWDLLAWTNGLTAPTNFTVIKSGIVAGTNVIYYSTGQTNFEVDSGIGWRCTTNWGGTNTCVRMRLHSL